MEHIDSDGFRYKKSKRKRKTADKEKKVEESVKSPAKRSRRCKMPIFSPPPFEAKEKQNKKILSFSKRFQTFLASLMEYEKTQITNLLGKEFPIIAKTLTLLCNNFYTEAVNIEISSPKEKRAISNKTELKESLNRLNKKVDHQLKEWQIVHETWKSIKTEPIESFDHHSLTPAEKEFLKGDSSGLISRSIQQFYQTISVKSAQISSDCRSWSQKCGQAEQLHGQLFQQLHGVAFKNVNAKQHIKALEKK